MMVYLSKKAYKKLIEQDIEELNKWMPKFSI